ncbi:hypothetical protein CAPTEDRAFT_127412 [Capitella teleta]|uniref:Peptidase S8/S53 domain-containing protein n=1 Tax=Capitella teleta TaxID=283909 RepID=R7VFN0_CAPTE|nr:hypothetical protein CAPTEDRAFT_127412 [Capitella teleta]|eukprot:ELU17424.1 hypothetical protein CAPTEDRAFT_127412 [Capitella teleta]
MLPSRNASGECFKQQSGRLNWHLSRISSREKILNYGDRVQYTYSSSDDGADIDVYVMDSGIYLEHSEFEGRAKWGMTANSIYEGNGDLNGHGTHVASLVGGKTNGVAKGVNIIAVKVFDMSGQGSAVNIIEGIAWIAQDVESKRKGRKKRRAVVNMSFGFTRAVNVVEGALTELIAGGTSVVVAAGNSFVSACRICPARMASVTTVGASTIYSTLAWFSNYGSCVDIIAPGDEILGAGIEKPDTRVRQSGTSMAAPIVAGVAARFLSSFEDDERWPTPAEVQTYLIDHGNQNFLDLSNSGTPNVEVYSGISGCEDESENGVLCLAAPSLVQLLLVVLVLVKLLK